MNTGIGTKGGKKDRKLSFLNRRKKQQLKQQEFNKQKEQEEKENKRKKEENIILEGNKEQNTDVVIEFDVKTKIEVKKESSPFQPPLNDKLFSPEKKNPPMEQKNKKIPDNDNNIDISSHDKEQETLQTKEKNKTKEPVLTGYLSKAKKKKGKNTSIEKNSSSASRKKDSEEKMNYAEEFLEKQIIKVLEQDIQEKKYQLKKIDSEIYAIQKSIDYTMDEEELFEIEKEIQQLMDMIEQIKRQIISLEKTFDLKFPVEEPDNYLIYLVEEYKSHRKEKKEISKKLEDNLEFKSLIDTMIEIEEKQKMLEEKMQSKKDQLELDQEQIEKLNSDVINIEEINQSVEKILEEHKKTMEEIKQRVSETVHITEKVSYITKNVNHTMLELFLLMAVLKRNLNIKNNAIAATTAALTLDTIIKMTTPIQEKKIIKEYDIKDYENMIRNCMNDTTFLAQMIHNNLKQISSIRYTFEKDYQSCSYLPSYQEALQKLTNLEEDMKERESDITRMKRDIELQLEKNNAKVKKYDSMKAA